MKNYILILAILISSCNGGGGASNNPPAPSASLAFDNAAILATPGGEGTPVYFNGQLLVIMAVRVGVSVPHIQVWNYTNRALLSDFEAPQGMTLICALVDSGRLYIFGVTNLNMTAVTTSNGNSIVMLATSDLITWDAPQTVYTFPSNIAGYNLSVTPAPGGYVMGYDYGPSWQQGFLSSPDLIHWTSLPGHFQANPWSSAVTLRYLSGEYYLFYSTEDNLGNYYTAAVRSTDLLNWQSATKAVIYPTEPFENINTTDFDFVEVKGVVYTVFAVGDQSGNGATATATYNGTFQQMVTALFQ